MVTLEEEVRATLNPGKPLRRWNVKRSGSRFMSRLEALGVTVHEATYDVTNLPPEEILEVEENSVTSSLTIVIEDLSVPQASPYHPVGDDVVSDTSMLMFYKNSLTLEARMSLDGVPFNMVFRSTPNTPECHLFLTIPISLSISNPITIDRLSAMFRQFGFQYDLTEPGLKERLAPFDHLRVPAEIVDYGRSAKSILHGRVETAGIKTHISLYLQDPNPEKSLNCYEVEIADSEHPISAKTDELAPESIRQPDQHHYCMIGENGYPFFPVPLERMSKLAMVITDYGSSPKSLDRVKDVPLSFDGSNQWFASGSRSHSGLQLLFNPDWEPNTAVVFHQGSRSRINPDRLYRTMVQMVSTLPDLIKKVD